MKYEITAETRTNIGRRSKDELKKMRIPAAMYGKGVPSQVITLPKSAFVKMYAAAGFSSLVDIAVDGKSPVKAVIKEIQLHPLTNEIVHADFHQIRMDEKMTVRIPLVFIGESIAVKGLGGTLIKSMDEVEVSCLPADLPHEITIDLSTLATFEDSITVSSLKLSKGVEILSDEDATIATVARPMTEDELKKLDEPVVADLSAIKSEADLKKEEAAKKEAEEKAAE
jgi:large subunit ribosomal protein L25